MSKDRGTEPRCRVRDVRLKQGSVLVFVAASTRCFSDKPFAEACFHLGDLEYEKIEIWMDEQSEHLKPSTVIADPEGFFARFRDSTRLAPVAFHLGSEVPTAGFTVLSKLAKQFRVTQITIEAGPHGTPFNSEVDRLRDCLRVASQDGVRVSINLRGDCLAQDPQTAIELCQAAPGLGITLDPSYLLCGPLKGKECPEILPYVYHVHLRDSSTTQLQVPVGLGEIEYSRIVSQLERIKYNRALSVELFPDQMDLESRPIELRKMRLLLESLM